MNLSIITPEKTLFSGPAVDATLPGAMGEFGVLQLHEPLVSTLKPGVIVATLENGACEKFAVLGGVAQVQAEGVAVLCELAQPLAGLTLDKAQSALVSARTALEQALPEEESARKTTVALAELAVAGLTP